MDMMVFNQLAFYLGIGLGLAGSAWGLSIAFQAAIGVGQKQFYAVIPLAVLPSTQGIYSLLGGILKKDEFAKHPEMGGLLLLVGVACLISAIYQGKVCASGIRAIGEGRNTLGNGIVAAAMPETYAVFAFVCLFLL
jgi:V/A-type H+/Na+-transporting ATPase subunit K